ncbi:MAG: hypothetical protein AAFX10_03840 [Pseudomonadota bacterium]
MPDIDIEDLTVYEVEKSLDGFEPARPEIVGTDDDDEDRDDE